VVEPEPINVEEYSKALRRLSAGLPGELRFRFESTLNHIDKSLILFDFDREMASFRAITAEEEAATALMHALRLRRYAHAQKFNPRSHQHKAAILACLVAIRNSVQPLLVKFNLIFDYKNTRIDIKLPLSNFGVEGGENFALQPSDPLDFLHSRSDVAEKDLFTDVLDELAGNLNFRDIKAMVASQANHRNMLLYASDNAVPKSRATLEALQTRQLRSFALLTLTVMIWQKKGRQTFVSQAILAFLGIISALPSDDET